MAFISICRRGVFGGENKKEGKKAGGREKRKLKLIFQSVA
jgi:hypothetical protein